nr:MAG TPA: hypothetical protein [Caudoviricetes sp.]
MVLLFLNVTSKNRGVYRSNSPRFFVVFRVVKQPSKI